MLTSTYIPYNLNINNIPKNGIVVSLPVNTKKAPELRRKAESFGVRHTRLPHNGFYISVLDAENMTQEAIDFLNEIEAFRRERNPQYSCEMKWDDIYQAGKSFPYRVYIGKVKNIGAESFPNSLQNYDGFSFISQVFCEMTDSIIQKINDFAGKSVVQISIDGDHYIDWSNMTQNLWDMLVENKYASGFVGYLNPDRIKEAKVKICFENGPRKPYKNVIIIFGKE